MWKTETQENPVPEFLPIEGYWVVRHGFQN
jgi:hypothetical protein